MRSSELARSLQLVPSGRLSVDRCRTVLRPRCMPHAMPSSHNDLMQQSGRYWQKPLFNTAISCRTVTHIADCEFRKLTVPHGICVFPVYKSFYDPQNALIGFGYSLCLVLFIDINPPQSILKARSKFTSLLPAHAIRIPS